MRSIATLFYSVGLTLAWGHVVAVAQPQSEDAAEERAKTAQVDSEEQLSSLKPRIVYQPPVKYPAPAVGSRVLGNVRLELLIDSDGVLEEAKALETEPVGYGFEASALEFAKRMRFVPPQVNEIKVRSKLEIMVRFTARMLIEELRSRGLFEEADLFRKRAERSKDGRLDSAEMSIYGAYEDSTDVIGLSIHHLVDGPASEVSRIEERSMPEVEGPVGEVEGLVLEQGTRRPIANAQVKFNGFDVLRSTTPWGRFRFTGVPVGRLSVMVTRPGYASQTHVIEVKPGSAQEVRKIFLKPLSFGEREKLGQHIPPRVPTRHSLQRDELQSVAGVDSDLVKASRDLPGLYRAPFDLSGPVSARSLGARRWGGSGELIFRGGVEGGAYLLDTPTLVISHLNQSRSLLPTSMVSEVAIESDYALEIGRVGGGLMEIKLAEPNQDDRQIEAELNAYELSALVGGSVSSKTSMTAAAKVGTMRMAQTLIGAEEWLKYGVQVPNSQDLHILLNHSDGLHELSFLTTLHNSGWQNDFESPDLIQVQLKGDVGQAQNGMSARLRWRYRRPQDQLSNSLSLSYEQLNSYENVASGHSLEQSLGQLFIADRFKIRVAKPLWFTAGLEQQVRHSFIRQQGASAWVEGMGRAVNRYEPAELEEDKVFTFSPSAWLGLEGRWTQVHMLLGARATYWSESDEVTPEPRVSLRYTPAFGTILKLGSGLYTQQLRPRYFDRYIGVGLVDESARLKQGQIFSSSAGMEQRFTRELYLDITGFYRLMNRLLVADRDPTVRFASTGEGEAYGAEMLLRYDPDSRLYGWLSYSFTHARLRDRVGDPLRRSDHDQTHQLSAVGGVKLTPKVSFNARWRFVSGAPYSQLPPQTFDSDLGQASFGYSPVNGLRYAPFHQLDLRLDYRWVFREWSLLSYLQLNNVYDHQSAELPHPLDGLSTTAPTALQSWPFWASFGLRSNF